MEELTLFISIIFIVFGVLQIILFFKLWGMTNDMKDVVINMNLLVRNSNTTTKHLCRDEYIKLCDYSLESKGITCVVENFKVIFSDGTSGELEEVKSSYSGNIYGVVTDDNQLLVYVDIDDACAALHEYLASKNELQKNLFRKIEYTSKE